MRFKVGTALLFAAAALAGASAIDRHQGEGFTIQTVGLVACFICFASVGLLNLCDHRRQQRRDREA
ncbi:hypothetical protein GCM10009650_12320 [Nesterenkonia jeotgali]